MTAPRLHRDRIAAMRHVPFNFAAPEWRGRSGAASQPVSVCAGDTPSRDERCREVYDIQVQGL